jgi:hypothetical protein
LTRNFAYLALASALLATPLPASANDNTRVVVDVAGGRAVTSRPEDQPGDITLLYGTAFAGPAFRLGAGVTHDLAETPLAVRMTADVGVVWLSGDGYASVGAATRTLVLSLTALEPLLGLELGLPLKGVEPYVGFSFGPRLGLRARAVETRSGFASSEAAPELRVGAGLLGVLELGATIDAGPVVIPLALRLEHDLAYPSTTAGRLDGGQSPESPGAYRVGFDFVWLTSAGVGFALP